MEKTLRLVVLLIRLIFKIEKTSYRSHVNKNFDMVTHSSQNDLSL